MCLFIFKCQKILLNNETFMKKFIYIYIYIYIYMLYMLYDGKRFGQVRVTYSMYQLLSPGGFFRAKKFHLSDL